MAYRLGKQIFLTKKKNGGCESLGVAFVDTIINTARVGVVKLKVSENH